jgi:PilZ domain-containing protein
VPVHGRKDSAERSRRERRFRRFDLQFPVRLSFPSNGTDRELDTISQNLSIGGLLLTANESLPPQTRVRLTIEVQDPRLRQPFRLLGEGAVVRVEPLESGVGFAIAIECKHPVKGMENHLPATG